VPTATGGTTPRSGPARAQGEARDAEPAEHGRAHREVVTLNPTGLAAHAERARRDVVQVHGHHRAPPATTARATACTSATIARTCFGQHRARPAPILSAPIPHTPTRSAPRHCAPTPAPTSRTWSRPPWRRPSRAPRLSADRLHAPVGHPGGWHGCAGPAGRRRLGESCGRCAEGCSTLWPRTLTRSTRRCAGRPASCVGCCSGDDGRSETARTGRR